MATAFLTPDLLQAKRRRLNQLEERAATSGLDTPPEVKIEIEDLRSELDNAVIAPASEADRYVAVFEAISELRRDVRQMYWLMPILMVLLCGFLVLLVKYHHAQPPRLTSWSRPRQAIEPSSTPGRPPSWCLDRNCA